MLLHTDYHPDRMCLRAASPVFVRDEMLPVWCAAAGHTVMPLCATGDPRIIDAFDRRPLPFARRAVTALQRLRSVTHTVVLLASLCSEPAAAVCAAIHQRGVVLPPAQHRAQVRTGEEKPTATAKHRIIFHVSQRVTPQSNNLELCEGRHSK